MTSPISSRARAFIAATAGLFTGVMTVARTVALFPQHRDAGQIWYAGRAILRGVSPYAVIGRGLEYEWSAFFYPMPAALLGVPLAPFSEPVAMGLFVGLGIAAMAWALMEHGYAPLLGLASACVANATYAGQWAPLYAGAFVLAPIGVSLIAKPTIGAAVFVAKPSWWAVGGGLALLALSFLIQPDWVAAWQHGVQSSISTETGKAYRYTNPIAFPGGFLVLMGLLRWRRPEARLLVALACVPQMLLPYEGTLLFLIPRTLPEVSVLVLASYAMQPWIHLPSPTHPIALAASANGPVMVCFLYLPCLLIVLRRPNEGTVPTWLESAIRYFPLGLRGVPQTQAPHPSPGGAPRVSPRR